MPYKICPRGIQYNICFRIVFEKILARSEKTIVFQVQIFFTLKNTQYHKDTIHARSTFQIMNALCSISEPQTVCVFN